MYNVLNTCTDFPLLNQIGQKITPWSYGVTGFSAGDGRLNPIATHSIKSVKAILVDPVVEAKLNF